MKKVAEYLLITLVLIVLVAIVSAGGLAKQVSIAQQGSQAQQPVADPNCPSLVNDGEEFQHYTLYPCHTVTQIIEIAAHQSGDISNETGHDIQVLWNGERRDIANHWNTTFLGPGRLEAPAPVE